MFVSVLFLQATGWRAALPKFKCLFWAARWITEQENTRSDMMMMVERFYLGRKGLSSEPLPFNAGTSNVLGLFYDINVEPFHFCVI